MEIFYFNDTKHVQYVYCNTLDGLCLGLQPATGAKFKIRISKTQIPFIKVWDTNVVLISAMDKD